MSRWVAATRPRLLGTAAVALLASATLAFGAELATRPPATPAAAPAATEHLVVPDVTGQVFVFAKGMLEEAGFAWKVTGPVDGYAANRVSAQKPKAGTRVVDTGSPVIEVTLTANGRYRQKGRPENEAPYRGTPLELVLEDVAAAKQPLAGQPARQPAAAKPAAAPAVKTKPGAAAARPAAFVVPGAPAEPKNEISLPQRAQQLAAWLETHPNPTDANVRHWLYQHSWIVTGATFGWWGGAQALELLVRIDRRAEQLWGVGARSRTVAEKALAEVRANSR